MQIVKIVIVNENTIDYVELIWQDRFGKKEVLRRTGGELFRVGDR